MNTRNNVRNLENVQTQECMLLYNSTYMQMEKKAFQCTETENTSVVAWDQGREWELNVKRHQELGEEVMEKSPTFNRGDSYKRLYICQKMDIFFIEGKLNLTKDDFKK